MRRACTRPGTATPTWPVQSACSTSFLTAAHSAWGADGVSGAGGRRWREWRRRQLVPLATSTPAECSARRQGTRRCAHPPARRARPRQRLRAQRSASSQLLTARLCASQSSRRTAGAATHRRCTCRTPRGLGAPTRARQRRARHAARCESCAAAAPRSHGHAAPQTRRCAPRGPPLRLEGDRWMPREGRTRAGSTLFARTWRAAIFPRAAPRPLRARCAAAG